MPAVCRDSSGLDSSARPPLWPSKSALFGYAQSLSASLSNARVSVKHMTPLEWLQNASEKQPCATSVTSSKPLYAVQTCRSAKCAHSNDLAGQNQSPAIPNGSN
jgi:hypothetical protein